VANARSFRRKGLSPLSYFFTSPITSITAIAAVATIAMALRMFIITRYPSLDFDFFFALSMPSYGIEATASAFFRPSRDFFKPRFRRAPSRPSVSIEESRPSFFRYALRLFWRSSATPPIAHWAITAYGISRNGEK
jgi:hypothetical protein